MTVQEAIKVLNNHRLNESNNKELIVALLVAIECMEKQMPKKPNMEQKDCVGDDIPRCPNCLSMYIEKHCAKCGQKIDWGE